ncbi:Chlorophenol O-methyltransferase [Cladobotryum mycophilum]|uniref:Chlorophenol O-methyltransferase n=1 Tax=Cladobotryum mycophilum TaxID=491253 RepID=A0ABR0SNS6_9HYPO
MDLSITELAAQISQLASTLSAELGARGLPQPGLSRDSLDAYPTDDAIHKSRMTLIDAAQSLLNLAIGPTDYLNWLTINTPQDLNALNILYKFSIFHVVPLNGAISYTEIAQKTDLSEQLIRRILDRAILMSLFRETAPGTNFIEHTSFSAEKKHPQRSAPQTPSRGREKGSPRETGMALHFFPDAPDNYSFFDFLAEDGRGEKKGYRARRFDQVMAHDAEGVGGSTGHITIEIAKQFPDLRFIVSDLPQTEKGFDQVLEEESGLAKDRISFLGHDFFQPWPQIDVDIIMMRHVLHDWSDPYAAKLILNLIPILKPEARLFIIESAMADSTQSEAPLAMKKFRSSIDLAMLALLNGRERTSSDWENLFTGVDKRFKVRETGPVSDSRSMFIDIVFDGE